MPKKQEIKKVLVIGSGPIIIGQAAEFDYAGTQACRALREEGIEVVLVNSNPATIMTDSNMADKVYIEPLLAPVIENIIIKEKPDSILPTLGGQTGLNLAVELAESGFLAKHKVKLLGTAISSIKAAEDRQLFKDAMAEIGQPCIKSKVVESVEAALSYAEEIGYPVIVRPAYTMGGTGGGIAYDPAQLREIGKGGIRHSMVHQILIEKCVSGWKEIEFEAIRDAKGNAITVCSMENLDPVGVHTGDSIVVAPAQTLSDKEYGMLRGAALSIISALKIEGGCNIQFALHPESLEYGVIEVNPRVSRSSALASKATGYPIARVAAKIAIGYGLDEILNKVTGTTYACFEPTIDYTVIKFPKWPFDKFVKAKRTLGTQMKATGEVMSIATSIEGALMKAIRSLELKIEALDECWFVTRLDDASIKERIHTIDDERIFVVAEALRRGLMTMQEINDITKIDVFFLSKIKNLVDAAEQLKTMGLADFDEGFFRRIKTMGFTDKVIARYIGTTPDAVTSYREQLGVKAVFKTVDTCAAEFEAVTPYYYSTYDSTGETVKSDRKKILIIGSGPIRIGQGIEFDYCSVHGVWSLKKLGYETIIINNNPETVSTDFDTSDKLYFEPLTPEDVRNIVETEQPDGAIVQFGGQTAIKLAAALEQMGVKIIGTQPSQIDAAEDREKFDEVLEAVGLPRAAGALIYTAEEAVAAANKLGYPVLVRPSYVLGGQGMEIAYSDSDVAEFMEIINRSTQDHPVLVDKYLMGKELEVDAICDGEQVLIPGIMEHLERAGVHSGDSISVFPPISLSDALKAEIVEASRQLALRMDVRGLINIQYVYYEGRLYIIEANPRASRTIPYISKVTGLPVVEIATRCMFGEKLSDMGYGCDLYQEPEYYSVKVPVFSFEKLHDVDNILGPEMKSTGEVLGIARDFETALYKGIIGSGIKLPEKGSSIITTVRNADKEELVGLAKGLYDCGYPIYATEHTAQYLAAKGVAAQQVNRIGEEAPNILDVISSGQVGMVINTPTRGRQQSRDGFRIRRRAVEMSIPCLTSLDTAQAVLKCIKLGTTPAEVPVLDLDIFKK